MARQGRADPSGRLVNAVHTWLASTHGRVIFDRVHDFHVTRAAAEVSAKVAGDLIARWIRIRFDGRMAAHRHPGDAEAALNAAAAYEGVGDLGSDLFGQPLQSDDFLARDLL